MEELYSARRSGRRAYLEGWTMDDNPFIKETYEHWAWTEGWKDERLLDWEKTFNKNDVYYMICH